MCKSIAALASIFFGAKLKGEVERAGFNYLGAIGENGLMKHAAESTPVAIFLDLGKDDVDFKSLVSTLRSNETTTSSGLETIDLAMYSISSFIINKH